MCRLLKGEYQCVSEGDYNVCTLGGVGVVILYV